MDSVALASPILGAIPARMTISQRILAALADGEMTYAEVASRMPDVKKGSFAPAMVRLVNDGRLIQPCRASYRIAEQPEALPMTASDIRGHIVGMHPGKVFGYVDLIRDLSASHSNMSMVLRDLLKSGYVVRVARGMYARSGGTVRLSRSQLPKYTQVLRILEGRKGPMTGAQVHAALTNPETDKDGVYTLNNMFKVGLVERVSLGVWVITEKGRAYLNPQGRTDPAEAIIAALRPGSLLKVVDLFEITGLEYGTVSLAIDRLEAAGKVVHVVYGLWRLASAPTGLEAYGRSRKVEFLASILAAEGPYTSTQFHEEHGEPVKPHSSNLNALIKDGLVQQVGYGLKLMDPAWGMAIKARLSSVVRRVPLTAVGDRLVKALRDKGPLRKAEIAALAGTNRGVAIRLVDRLVAEGRMIEVAPGRYMLG